MHRPAQRDNYATLGLRRSASQQEVKRTYRDLAKRYHPDVDLSPQAAERFMAVHAAYATLHDPILRIAYDAMLYERERRPAPKPAAHKPGDTPRYRQREEEEAGPDIKVRSWAFIGLHVTGLLFGSLLVLAILAGITFRNWSWGCILFITPGLIVLPDAWDGLSLAFRRKRRATA